MTSFISKTNYMRGLQCPLRLWVHVNDKSRLPEIDAGVQFIFDQGHAIGELARSLHPKGILIDRASGINDMLLKTKDALSKRLPIFEAAFSHENMYAQIDLLLPYSKDRWDIIEVKSTGSVKEEHIPDVAFQLYLCLVAGLKIHRCYLQHVDTGYVRHGEIDGNKFLMIEDVTSEAKALLPDIPAQVKQMMSVANSKKCPEVDIGANCCVPYECELIEECWKHLPADNIFDLYRGGAKSWDLYEKGILKLKDIPDDFPLADSQRIQVESVRSRKPHIDCSAIAKFINRLEYPIHFLDFETAYPAIPLYDNTHPYGQVPFQYSLIIQEKQGGRLKKHGFLAKGKDDPRPEFMESLRKHISNNGSIVAFNDSFERKRLTECAECYPEYEKWVSQLLPRFVDLWKPFRSFHYYHPKQHGSASQKNVLPALAGKGYDDLEIRDGGTASICFLEMTFGNHSPKEREAMRTALKLYCHRDVEGMMDILNALGKACKK